MTSWILGFKHASSNPMMGEIYEQNLNKQLGMMGQFIIFCCNFDIWNKI